MMEWLLLGVVCAGPEDGMSMSAVAQTLDVTLPQVTALANKLLNLKLIKQKTHAQDRRSRRVMPTPKGRTVLEDVEQSVGKAMEEWLADLPEGQTANYFATMQWIVNHKYAEDGKNSRRVMIRGSTKDDKRADEQDADLAQTGE
jgi:DNA-binding MarR family transcriptional regulator